MMFKAYRFRIYPDDKQLQQLAKHFGHSRYLYNLLVEKHTQEGAMKPGNELFQFKQLCLEQPEFNDIHPSIANYTINNFKRCLERSKALNKKLHFKSANGRETFTLANKHNAVRVLPPNFLIKDLGILKARMYRLPTGQILNIHVSKTASGRYYLSLLTHQPDLSHSSISQKEKIRCIGLDMGIKHFLTMSNGIQIANPRYFDEDLKRLRLMQKTLARRIKGSSNYQKQRRLIARHHERIATRRNAFLHKLSTQIIREYDIIAVEKLAINDLLADKQLSRKISDASWRKFITMLAYKADWYGKQLIQIDRYYPSSKTCCKCHYKIEELPLYVRDWQCPSCETPHDRDINAAINIMTQGVKIYLKNNPDARKMQQLIPALSDRR